MALSKQEMESFLPLQGPLIKKLVLQNVSHVIQLFQMDFQNRKWNFQTGNGIISPSSRPLIKKKLFLEIVSHMFQGFQN